MNNKVYFYRNGRDYFFRYNGKTVKVDERQINILKYELGIPYQIDTYGVSYAQFYKVLSRLVDSGKYFNYYSNIDNNKMLKIHAEVFDKEKIKKLSK